MPWRIPFDKKRGFRIGDKRPGPDPVNLNPDLYPKLQDIRLQPDEMPAGITAGRQRDEDQ